MSSSTVAGRVFLAIVLLVSFGGIFYTYNKPNINWFKCLDSQIPTNEVCPSKCLEVLKVENANLSLNIGAINYSLTTTKLLSVISPESKTTVLIWPWPFGFKFTGESCENLGIRGCHFTDDRTQLKKAAAVMFHLREVRGDVATMLGLSRPPWQKWVWMNMESPDNSGHLAGTENLFNLTANYRRDSDIWVPYGRIVQETEKDKVFQIPPKNKLVCWIVSNWNNNFKRVKYYNELSQHIGVEVYGRYFGKYLADEDYTKILSSCKFYLSFENSIYKDYFTEKLFNPLIFGTVPIVLGPSRENYEEFIPADSFIHVDDFKSPQELAEQLKVLDKNWKRYEQYFNWRNHFKAETVVFGQEHACRICAHVKDLKSYTVFKNLKTWYWG